MVATSGPMKNFVFTNNILSTGKYPVWSTGGGPKNCAFFDKPLTTFDACFKPYTFAGNVLIGDSTPRIPLQCVAAPKLLRRQSPTPSDSSTTAAGMAETITCSPQAPTRAKGQMARTWERTWMRSTRRSLASSRARVFFGRGAALKSCDNTIRPRIRIRAALQPSFGLQRTHRRLASKN